VHWFAYATVDGLDDELLTPMREAGCTRLGIGIESVVASTLDRAKCSLRYRRLDEIAERLTAVDRHGLLIRGYLMVGWPWETPDHYLATAEALRDLPIDQLRLAFAVPFSGVPLAGDYPLATDDLSRYTTNEPVYLNPILSTGEQLRLAEKVVRDHLNSPTYAAHIRNKVERFPMLKPSFAFFLRYLSRQGLVDDLSRSGIFESLSLASQSLDPPFPAAQSSVSSV
jgi:radical SAM superfamily enzyme YgiQ (UPF0313 family)